MIVQTSRLEGLRTAAKVVGVIAMLAGAVAIILSFKADYVDSRLPLVGAGLFAVLAGACVLIFTSLLLKIESSAFRLYSHLLEMHELAKAQQEVIERMAENSALSDAAKALANREKDCDSLRAAIRAELRMEKWESALALADGISERFGYMEEAKSLRDEIHHARNDTMRRRLDEAQSLIQSHLGAFEWEKALGEIERLERALPDEPRIARLRTLYDSSRAARKAELHKAWTSAVERNDVDEAIHVLRELDAYLTREEARELETSARGIFKAKLLQLGMQFQFAVNEKRWRDAIEVGLQINDEFPNSRMAKEVSEAMENLRVRAGLHGDVEVTTGRSHNAAPRTG